MKWIFFIIGVILISVFVIIGCSKQIPVNVPPPTFPLANFSIETQDITVPDGSYSDPTKIKITALSDFPKGKTFVVTLNSPDKSHLRFVFVKENGEVFEGGIYNSTPLKYRDETDILEFKVWGEKYNNAEEYTPFKVDMGFGYINDTGNLNNLRTLKLNITIK